MSSTAQALTVELPASTLYVSGTVNGVAVTWTNTAGNIWETVADRAADDIYHVSLTIIDEHGQASAAEITLYYGVLNLITDRSEADVANGSDKGYYNATDLARVEAAVDYVANRLRSLGYAVEVSPKKEWVMKDIPTVSQMARYLHNITTLRATLPVLSATPEAPADMEGLTWSEANNIEQILKDIDHLVTNMTAAWLCSGEIYSGEDCP